MNFFKFNIMNTDKKQSSNMSANEISKSKILNIEDDFINPIDPEEDDDIDEEDLDEEAENSVDSPGSDFNEIEEEIDEEVQ